MATYDPYNDPYYDPYREFIDTPIEPIVDPVPGETVRGPEGPTYTIEPDPAAAPPPPPSSSDAERQLAEYVKSLGQNIDYSSELDDIARHLGYDSNTQSLDQLIAEAKAKLERRAAPVYGGGEGGRGGSLDVNANAIEDYLEGRSGQDPRVAWALANGIAQSRIDRFRSENPGDEHRMLEAFGLPPLPPDWRGGPIGGGGGGGRGGGGGGRGGAVQDSRRGFEEFLKHLNTLGQRFGGPGSPGIFPPPVQQVGQDPLSLAITGGYADILGSAGQSALGKDMEQTLRGLISRGGAIDENPDDRAARIEAKRQPIEAFRRMQRNQLRGELANRHLISEPGAPQGSEISALGRFEEMLAPYYATAGQQLASEDFTAQNERLSQSLSLATALSQEQSKVFLSALQDATQRQQVLSDIALATLDRNMLWNKFLAEFGLQRDLAFETITRGRVEDIMPLMALFQQFVNTAAGGFI